MMPEIRVEHLQALGNTGRSIHSLASEHDEATLARHEARMPAVLVIDDDPDIVAMLSSVLAEHGYQVLAAVDRQALRLAHDAHPDVNLARPDNAADGRC